MDNQNFRNRPLHIHVSSRTGPKRLATTVVSRVSRSHSPGTSTADGQPNANGAEASTPTPMNHAPDDDEKDNDKDKVDADSYPAAGDRSQRTLGLMYVPDTVNDARIRSLAEPFGPLVKIVLRPDHQGAIVEFRDVGAAGKAAMALDGTEIMSGREIRVGSVGEMLRCGAERKVDKIRVGKQKEPDQQKKDPQKEKGPSSSTFMRAPIRRPAQPGPLSGRDGRRGGLGVKRNETTQRQQQQQQPSSGNASQSNSDFRAMLEKSRAKPKEEE